MDSFSVGTQIRKERLRRGFTQVELSEATGIPQTTISAIERGERNGRRSPLDKIAKILDIEVAVR